MIMIGAGTFELTAPLEPKSGMTIIGAGAGQTIIRNAASWNVGTTGLPDNGINQNTVDASAYLLSFPVGTTDVTLRGVTLTGPELHGALYCDNCDGLIIEENEFDDFLWSSIRIFRVDNGVIRRNSFVDAGGRSGVTSGQTGAGIYATFTTATDIHDNRFTKTADHPSNYFGIKGRKATDTRIFNNTIMVSFSIEFPFENDDSVEIFANYLNGVVSIPKFAGGPLLPSGESFIIRNNYFTKSYSIEGPRNGLVIHNNLFDFETDDDGGNLITVFGDNGSPVTPGPLAFHNNNIKNPGRGIFWSAPIHDDLSFHNNHIIANTTITPRTEGLFGFKLNANNAMEIPDLSTINIRDNIIELIGMSRDLIRNPGAADISSIVVENNTLINVSDSASYPNPDTGAPRGPILPLRFSLGVDGEFIVNGFEIVPRPTCTGDINGDSAVNLADFNILAVNFGAGPNVTILQGDLNDDASVNLADFNILAVNFGSACP